MIEVMKQIAKDAQPPSPFVIGRLESLDGRVKFDGEQTASTKKYAMMDSYTPAIGQRVLLARVGGSYVILGGITRG